MPTSSSKNGFASGTLILMADGTTKPIESLHTGDMIMSFNLRDADAPLEPKIVEHTYKRLDRDLLEVKTDDNKTLHVAPGQLFINPGDDWRFATETAYIVDLEGNAHKFDVNRIDRGKHWIYDITVEKNHSLIANGIRVHNLLAGANGGPKNNPKDTGRAGVPGTGNRTDSTTKDRNPPDKTPRNTSPNDKQTKSPNTKESVNNPNNGGRGKGGDGPNGGGPQNTNNVGSNKKKKNNKNKDKSEPSGPATAISTLTQIRDQMDFICTLLAGTEYSKWLTYKSAAITATDNSLTLASAYLDAVLRSTMLMADKSTLITRQGDITNAIIIIKAEMSKTSTLSILTQSVINACGNVNQFVAQSLEIISKYVGNTTQNKKKYDVKVDNIQTPKVTNTTVIVDYRSGGTGASYNYDYRIVNGKTYQFIPGTGWVVVQG